MPENRTLFDEIDGCLDGLANAVIMAEFNSSNEKLKRLQAYGSIWYGLLTARFKRIDHYREAWDFLELIKSPPYTRTAKLWQAHLIIRNEFFRTGNQVEAFTIAGHLLERLKPETRERRANVKSCVLRKFKRGIFDPFLEVECLA